MRSHSPRLWRLHSPLMTLSGGDVIEMHLAHESGNQQHVYGRHRATGPSANTPLSHASRHPSPSRASLPAPCRKAGRGGHFGVELPTFFGLGDRVGNERKRCFGCGKVVRLCGCLTRSPRLCGCLTWCARSLPPVFSLTHTHPLSLFSLSHTNIHIYNIHTYIYMYMYIY